MNNFYANTKIALLLFFLIFIIFCNGQDKTNKLPCHDVESDKISNDTLVKENQTAKTPWVDPLFFIDGQLCQHVRRIFQDTHRNLWFGTNVYGLMRYKTCPNDSGGRGDTLVYYSENDGLGGGRITGIVEDKEGNVWFGTYGGLTKYDPSAEEAGEIFFTNFTEQDGLVNNEIWSLTIDSKGIFWIGTMEGVSRFDGLAFTTFPIPKAQVKDTTTILSYNRVTCILEDKNRKLWFGTDGFGICIYDPLASHKQDGKMFTHFTKEDGLCDNNIYDLMEDKKGNIWIGTMYGGVSMFDGRLNDKFGQGKTLPDGEAGFTNFTQIGIINGIEAGGFYEDKTGNIWFAAENFGVYRYNPSSDQAGFTNFYTKDGLITNGILSIIEDKEGRFWFGGWGGLFRYYPSAAGAGRKSFFPVTKEGPWQ